MSKLVIIGFGNVGKNYCFSLINQNIVDEIVLIDTDKDKLTGNYLDLLDSVSFSNAKLKIGDYSDCSDADLIVITAGKNQDKGETRLDLIKTNDKIIKSICDNIKQTSFDGIILVATNPLDVCTYLVKKYTNYPDNKIIGSGTFLDTIRLRRILAKKFNVKLEDVKTYVVGEHGDSSVIVWSKTFIKNQNIDISDEEKNNIELELHNVAYNIINLKKETSFGVSSCLTYITKCILNNLNREIIVSSYTNGIFISNLCMINSSGVRLNKLDLTDEELIKYNNSKRVIIETINSLEV